MKSYILIALILMSISGFAQNYQFLGNYTSNGTPTYLIVPGDSVSDSTMQLIEGALPDEFPVPDYNPHYISSGYDTDISLKADAEIFVTFLKEDTGYRNVLGFYTYMPNNPPKTAPAPEDITIIFPNASAENSGGGLNRGDKVSLGFYPNGTSICFVLLADGWDGSTVTPGNDQYYSNPEFNPELSSDLKQHHVLLADIDNERVFLGYEDIRRDSSQSDHDFNDNLFYITASSFHAMKTANMIDIKTATDVSSGNDGGLESNGSLADLIAKRSFLKVRNNQKASFKSTQNRFFKNGGDAFKSGQSGGLVNYIPETGLYGIETAYISSPEDLVEITNAISVYSVDYYLEDSRVAAVFATETRGWVYDHTKVICDRLNSSSLEDIRTVLVKGHQMIITRIKRVNGSIENSISFSIKQGDSHNNLYSFWSADQYPEGNYYNFQIWGNSFSQMFALVNQILDAFSGEKQLLSQYGSDKIPTVFAKSGNYYQGRIGLNIINKSGSKDIWISGSYSPFENGGKIDINQRIELSGNLEDSISIYTGSLFDIGFSIISPDSPQFDLLYLADGPWGLDYNEDETIVESFMVGNMEVGYDLGSHTIERQPSVSGQIKGTINLFRQILPGNQSLNVSKYNNLVFSASNSHPLEVILMTDDLQNWDERLRYRIPVSSEETEYNVSFESFTDGEGKKGSIEKVNRIVFSLQGNYTDYAPFTIDIHGVAFYTSYATSYNQLSLESNVEKLINYPNPFESLTTIKLPQSMKNFTIEVVDINGRVVDYQHLSSDTIETQFEYRAPNLVDGFYYYIVRNNSGKRYRGTLLIQRR